MKTQEQLLKDLQQNGFEIYTLEEEEKDFGNSDSDLIDEMKSLNCSILLHNGYMARNWYFTTLDALVEFFQNGGKVGYDDANRRIA